MRYLRARAKSEEGVAYVQAVVAKHGSVFRPIHGEHDLSVDGFIEMVEDEEASGHMVAVQVKSGPSYLCEGGRTFRVHPRADQLDYWLRHMVPVILVCHSPEHEDAAWVSVRDYVEYEAYHERLPVKAIHIARSRRFDVDALSGPIGGLARAGADERLLIRCADMCLDRDAGTRKRGFEILSVHPASAELRVTCLLARRLALDDDDEIAKQALHTLGYGVGRARWSWNPHNVAEREVMDYAGELCSDFREDEVRRLVELVDGEHFHGPDALGERVLDVLGCCPDTAMPVLEAIIREGSQPLERRANALYLSFGCDDDMLEESLEGLRADPATRDVARLWSDEAPADPP